MTRRIFVLAFALVASAACGPSAEEACSRSCDCQGCSKNQRKACLIYFSIEEEEAKQHGCSEQYGDMISCKSAGVCVSGMYYETACEAEESAFKKCIGQ